MHRLRTYAGFWALLLIIEAVVAIQLRPPKFEGWEPVTVSPGQTLWQIGQSHCPNVDPRDVFQAIEERNHINSHIQPGQVVLVPTQSMSWWAR